MPNRKMVTEELRLLRDFLLREERKAFKENNNRAINVLMHYRNIVIDALALLKEQEPITGETSDGYHTFNELYHHRAVLFSVIVANYPDRAWKSKKHHDGTMYNNMFIVGIDTPDGQATYHYDVEPYWDMFKCRVLDNAPEWDGHTPAQAIERIGKLKALETEDTGRCRIFQCKKCGFGIDDIFVNDEAKYQILPSYCPNCGRSVKWIG